MPVLSPVYTSNKVEATFDFVEATFDFVETIVRLVGPYKQTEHLICIYSVC